MDDRQPKSLPSLCFPHSTYPDLLPSLSPSTTRRHPSIPTPPLPQHHHAPATLKHKGTPRYRVRCRGTTQTHQLEAHSAVPSTPQPNPCPTAARESTTIVNHQILRQDNPTLLPLPQPAEPMVLRLANILTLPPKEESGDRHVLRTTKW